MEEIRKIFQEILTHVAELYCILITDRDGVTVLRMASENSPEQARKPEFLTNFGLAVDQGSKLGLGKTETLICYYSQYQVIQMNKLPLFVTFIGSESCNTGHILALEDHINSLLTNLTLVVADST